MPTERSPLSEPACYIKTLSGIRRAAKMSHAEWHRLRGLAICLAIEILDTKERFEHQDPDKVFLFYTTFDSKWPEIKQRYQNSWILVRYIKHYLVRRVYRQRRKAQRTPRTTRDMRSRSPLSSSETPVSCVNSSSSEMSASFTVPSDAIANSSEMATSSASESSITVPSHVTTSAMAPQHSRSSSSPDQIFPTLFQFLQSTKPSLIRLVPDFIAAGIYDQNRLEDFITWSAKAQSDFLLKTLHRKINALELGAITITLENRRRGC